MCFVPVLCKMCKIHVYENLSQGTNTISFMKFYNNTQNVHFVQTQKYRSKHVQMFISERKWGMRIRCAKKEFQK